MQDNSAVDLIYRYILTESPKKYQVPLKDGWKYIVSQ